MKPMVRYAVLKNGKMICDECDKRPFLYTSKKEATSDCASDEVTVKVVIVDFDTYTQMECNSRA